MKILIECGQRFWRYRSWVPFKYPGKPRWKNFFRKLPHGFAVGPVMLFKD